MAARVLQLHPDDNLAVAVGDLPVGTEVQVGDGVVCAREKIPAGHKLAIQGILEREPARKYGQLIGLASADIQPGDWIHTHNLQNPPIQREYEMATAIPPDPAPLDGYTFQGFRRASGSVGTRNYIGIISSVNCSASVSKYVARRFEQDSLDEFPNVDGVVAFTHEGGCAMQFAGERHEMLNRVMAGMARHPNIGAYLMIGLGCEQATIPYLIDSHQLVQIGGTQPATEGPPVLIMQEQGGTTKTIEAAVNKVRELLPRANAATREPVPASHLVVATECGGSDGNSGITANPAVGVASDMIVAAGGTAILAETPEVHGAEHLLTRRASDSAVAEKLLERIRWWHWYAGLFGAHLDNNPSMGNKAGGLTTIVEKSLGAVAKGGSTALRAVYEYAEPIQQNGFVFMDTPGFDPPSVTGMVAGGANVVLFTTGRGSCYGCKPVPSIKIASNTAMYRRMIDDMDIDAGTILQSASVQEIGQSIFQEILKVASGQRTKSEQHGIGQEEFVPWTVGPIL